MKIKLNKGLDLKIEGAITDFNISDVDARVCALIPDDFPGFVPKLDVKEGDKVEIGSPVMHDKNYPQLYVVSPVSGKVRAVVRGERRKLLRVEIESDGLSTARQYQTSNAGTREGLVGLLGESGLLAMMRRRPYDVIPSPDVTPRDIFVTAMDTAPLAVSPSTLLAKDAAEMLAAAVKALKSLTPGKVYVCHDNGWSFGNISGAEMVEVEGRHPAGNVGVQIANISPVNKGETVWTLDVRTLYSIGQVLKTGKCDWRTVVAVNGPEVSRPGLVRVAAGAEVKAILAGRLKDSDHHVRIVSGNVLTGTAVNEADGFLRYPYAQVTVIAEGDDKDELLGWASLAPSKMSNSRALPFRFLRKVFSPDARLNGGRRAMIMSGEYDKVLPMDIMAEYLLKAIISRNIDDMEALGIYEIAPEDFALCEYVDTSKLPVQQIVRDGLDFLRKELE